MEERQRQTQVGSWSETNLRHIYLPPSRTPASNKQGIGSHKVKITAGFYKCAGLGLRRLACMRKRKQGFAFFIQERGYNLQATLTWVSFLDTKGKWKIRK